MFDTKAQTQTFEAILAAILMLGALIFVMLAYVPAQQGSSAVQLEKYGEDTLMVVAYYTEATLSVRSVTGNLTEGLISWTDDFDNKDYIATSTNISVSRGDASIENGTVPVTKLYDFYNVTRPSSTHVARYDYDDPTLEPATAFDATGTEFQNDPPWGSRYLYIWYSGDFPCAYTSSPLLTDYMPQHIFRFRIDEPKTAITGLTVTWEGYNRLLLGLLPWTTSNGVQIWNCTASKWETVGDVTSSERAVSKSYTGTAKASNYIDGNGNVTLMAYAWRSGLQTIIYTDYVKLELRHGGYKPSGALTSVPINSTSAESWNKFYANATVPPLTTITYKILNAANNSSVCGTISAAEAAQGFDISSCAKGLRSIRLFAQLNSSDPRYSPRLHNWGVDVASTSPLVRAIEDEDWTGLDEKIEALLPENVEHNLYFHEDSGEVMLDGIAQVEHGPPGPQAVSVSKLVYARDPRGGGYNVYEVQLVLWYK